MARSVASLVCWPGLVLAAIAMLAHGTVQAGPAFDCKQARTAVDRLLCSDTVLGDLDRDLAGRYAHLRQGISPDGAVLLRDGQRAWLASRAACATGENANQRDAATACLTSLYRDRGDSLATQYRRAGGLMLEPRQVLRTIRRVRVQEINTYPWLTGEPSAAAAAFNRYVVTRLKPAGSLFAASGIELDPKPSGETTFDRFYEIHRFDDRLISIEIFAHHESYFGHGWRSESALNWDLKSGRPVRIAGLFRPAEDWHEAVTDHALTWLRESGDFSDPGSLLNDADLDDDEGWLFDDDGALLLLGRGERSMVGGSADVPIPYGVLAPFLLPDAPLPMPAK